MSTWDPFREMLELRRELDRTFDVFVQGRQPGFSRLAFLPGRGARQYPLVNTYEDRDYMYVEALAPGVKPESLDLQYQGTTLMISGEKPAPEIESPESFHRSERAAGRFARTIELGVPVDDSKVEASYKQGLLFVKLPKSESAKPRQITVSVN
jgi:HSP20 family protein